MEINAIIKEKLNEIEKRENVKILHCVESGSRAWGFASPDSDYDVRFIYVRPKDFYLRLDKTRDVIEWQLDETLDINGWDLNKALCLLYKSNPTLFEWNKSPIVYKTSKEWEKISSFFDKYFVPKFGLYHYLGTAKTHYKIYFKSDIVKYKKYFYVLRPLLACEWILKKGTPPPMPFKDLMDECLDGSIRSDVMKLLDLKIKFPEIAEGKAFTNVNDYIEKKIQSLEEITKDISITQKGSWEELNKLFLEVVY